MKTMRFTVAIGLALALAGCGGDDGGSGGSDSVCEQFCEFSYDCWEPGGDRTTVVLSCALTCEVETASSCPDMDEAACRECFTGTCFLPETGCLNCNCLIFAGEDGTGGTGGGD